MKKPMNFDFCSGTGRGLGRGGVCPVCQDRGRHQIPSVGHVPGRPAFQPHGGGGEGEAPYNKEAFQKNAVLVDSLYRLSLEAFIVPGSDKGSGMKADALASKRQIHANAQYNRSRARQAGRCGQRGDLSAIKPQFGAAGASCKACHDAYKK